MPSVPFAVAALVKASLYTLCQSVEVHGLDNLLEALRSGRGLLTVSNHISVIDDPCALSAAVPLRYFLDKRTTRWTLGASDICFINPPASAFFRRGQVLETFRSSADPDKAGIYQPALDQAIQKIDDGHWLHVFPEAKVHQHPEHELLRFRWGVSRILMESRPDVQVLPIWLEGFDDLMPLERDFPRFIPRFFGTRIRIIIGPSITHRVKPLVDAYRQRASGAHVESNLGTTSETGLQNTQTQHRPRPPTYDGESDDIKTTRAEIARILREEVEKLGRASSEFGKRSKGRADREKIGWHT